MLPSIYHVETLQLLYSLLASGGYTLLPTKFKTSNQAFNFPFPACIQIHAQYLHNPLHVTIALKMQLEYLFGIVQYVTSHSLLQG